jgi:hypothetical protein
MASRDYDDNVRRQPGQWDNDTQGQGRQRGEAWGESRGGWGQGPQQGGPENYGGRSGEFGSQQSGGYGGYGGESHGYGRGTGGSDYGSPNWGRGEFSGGSEYGGQFGGQQGGYRQPGQESRGYGQQGGYGTHPNQGSSYGQGSSGWGSHWDSDYHQWREEQMRNLDNGSDVGSTAGAGSSTTTKHK